MSFTRTVQEVVVPLVVAERADVAQAHAAAVVAHHAPYVLRRLAEVAIVFDKPGLRSGLGAILATRSGGDGYRTVEYDAPDLAVALAVVDGVPRLRWRAGGEMDDRPLAMETPEAAIDAAILDAVSAYVNTRLTPVAA